MTGSAGRGSITLHLIGAFQVRSHGRLRSLPRSAERVVALVALVGPTDRSRASQLLWPDASGPRARANLRAAISRITAAAPGLLDTPGELLMMGENVTLDIDRARSWIENTIYEDPARAVNLPPPAGLGRPVLPGWDDEWIEIPRERLHMLQAQALETTAERLLTEGRHAEALPYALGAVELQPWSDSANRLVIEVYARRGDQSNALRRFQRFRRALERELGVQPSQEMLAAIRQLYPFAGAAISPESTR